MKMKFIDDYIQTFPDEIQTLLIELRNQIRQTAPKATERIRDRMPAVNLSGNLVPFAACKSRIGSYPTPREINQFAEELKRFKSSKGAFQFPVNQPWPIDLIRKIVAFRAGENMQKPKKSDRN